MSAFLQFIYRQFRPMMFALSYIAGIAIFVGIMYYAYTLYLAKSSSNNSTDIANANPSGRTITVYFFHVDWCPHCIKALPDWQMFVDEYNGKLVGGYTVECKDTDCTDNKNPAIKTLLDKFKVEQFPTVKGVVVGNGGKEITVDFDAKVKKTNLEQFVVSISQGNN